MTTAPPPQENAGLTSLVETIVAPASAFDRLAEKQTWGWAFIASSLLTAVGALASGPVTRHVTQLMMERQAAAATTSQQAAALANAATMTAKFSTFGWIFAPLGVLWIVLIATVILLICNALFGGKASFKQLWCASMNVSVVLSLGALLASIVIAIRGTGAITGFSDLFHSSISLAAIAPIDNLKILTILSMITPFSLWALWLNALIMQRIARMEPPRAWVAAIAALLLPALVWGAIARAPAGSTTGTPPTTSASASP
ncbi:MAG: hypothetical protein HKL92_06160 [Candidatus Eremiobacteraeota bacterium]|nr:YIP1 family protein [Candidatus Eremiobacteraeota bacterium]NNM92911.1 hypothetical protein [Candidatus Eremiobacteraeota bacterium]